MANLLLSETFFKPWARRQDSPRQRLHEKSRHSVFRTFHDPSALKLSSCQVGVDAADLTVFSESDRAFAPSASVERDSQERSAANIDQA